MIQIARALVDQRKAIAALSGITFSFDPQLATLDTYPRSLISVATPGAAFRGFAVVPFVAKEWLSCAVSSQGAKEASGTDFESLIKLLMRSIIARPVYFSRECRIHSQDAGPMTLSLSGAARLALLTWAGFASFEVRPAFVISPASASIAVGGATGQTFAVFTAADGAWTASASASASWITVTSGASGTGNGTVTYDIAANSGVLRTGSITIADQAFAISQAGV